MSSLLNSRHTTPVPRRQTRRLTTGECRDWVDNNHQARLAYASGRGPRAVVVNYATDDDAILIELADYNDAVRYASGAEVRVEVDGSKPDGNREWVQIIGRASVDTDARLGQTVEQWPEGVATSVVRVPLTYVEGIEQS